MLSQVAVLLALSPVSQTVVFWASAPVEPGQAVMVCGHFPQAERVAVRVARLPDVERPKPYTRFRRMTQPLKFRQVTPLTVSDTALVFELPDLGGPGVYLVSLETAEGAQKREVAQVLLNAAEVWSVVSDDGLYELQPNNGGTRERRLLVQRGAKLTVFGRCLKIGDRQPRAMLVSGDASGASSAVTALEVEAATPFCLHLRVPENAPLTRGAPAALVVTNGYGDESAASRLAGVAVRVLPKLPLPAQVYEPVSGAAPAERGTADWEKPAATVDATDFGADGYDAADDGEAIQEALDAAAKTQGTAVVKLPPGRLFVREPLRIPPHTLLQGAGREMTAICIPDTDEPPEAWLVGQHHFSIQDLTVYCSNHKHIITGDMSGDADKAGHVLLRRVRVRGDAFRGHLKPEDIDARLRAMLKLSTGGGDTVRFSGPDVIVEDCDLYGSGRSIYFYNVRGGVVRNSRLYNGRWGWYNFNVCRDVVIEGNLLAGADLMSTGGSYACYGPETCSENIYTSRNSYQLMHGWDREAFTSDAGGGAYFGGIVGARAATGPGKGQPVVEIELAEEPRWGQRPWTDALFAVTAGPGRGFIGRVVGYDGRRVQVQPLVGQSGPEDVHIWNADLEPPASAEVLAHLFDETSQATITQMHRHYIFEANEFSDAGVAIQYYGTAIEHIAVANKCSRAGGYHGLGITYAGGVQPDMYCQWLNNEILEGNSYRFGANNAQAAGPSHLAVIGRAPSINLGAVIRGNVLHNHARLRVISESSEVAVENVIVEGNTVRDSAVGLEVRNAKGALYRGNTFERCRREVVDLDRQTEQWRKAVEQEVPRDRALVAWSFDEARGRKIPGDCALPGADMTARVFGRVELVDGVRGRALRFDGNTYVEVDSDAARMALNLRNFTIAAWINPDVVKGRWGIVSKRTGHAGTPFVLATRDAALAYEATDDEGKWTTYNFASPPVLAAGQWQHVALVVEEGKRATLYLNGRPVATNEIKGQKLDSNDMPLRIGWEAWGGDPPKPDVPGFFHGAIDELSIWARALTDAEIGKLASTLAP